MALLFEEFSLEIVQATVAATAPIQTKALMQAVFHTQVSCAPKLDEARKVTFNTSAPLRLNGTHDSKSLRSFVSLGHEIHVLAHACIDYCLQRSMTMRPSSLVRLDPSHKTNLDRFEWTEVQEYQPCHAGSPS